MIKLGFDLDETDPGFNPLRNEFLTIYRDNLSQHSRLFPGMERVLTRLEEINASWGIVTNKPGWLTNPAHADVATGHTYRLYRFR